MRRTYFKKKKWTEEQEDWLIENKEIRGSKAMYSAFIARFPDATFTEAAIATKRTELGAYGTHPRDRRRNAVPLYSERKKKGYTILKVSKCEWWPKQKWVWVATHPGEEFDISNQFVFLDCDKKNFSPDNIEKVTHAEIGIVNRTYGGFVPGQPELNRALLLKIRLRLKTLDIGEKLGLTVNYGVGRNFRTDLNEKARVRRSMMTNEQREHDRAVRKAYVERKKKDPEWVRKRNEIAHRSYMRRRYGREV